MSTPTAYTPALADAAVTAKTGKDWSSWFAALDRAGAKQLAHKDIARWLVHEHGVSGWWSQSITVEYERSRGLREKHQTANGYSVSVTKTLTASLSQVYKASASAVVRRKWLPRGTFKVTSSTENRYVNAAWNDTARLILAMYSKGDAKTQITVQVNKLATKKAVEQQRKLWRAALAKLAEVVSNCAQTSRQIEGSP